MKLLGQCRKLLGITQVELAGSCHVTKSFISQIEQGKAVPSIPSLLLLTELFGQRSENYLFPLEKKEMRVKAGNIPPVGGIYYGCYDEK